VILADTSIWVEHFRRTNSTFEKLLDAGNVVTHPFVIGEIALGYLKRRDFVLDGLRAMPKALVASNEEVLDFIDQHSLFGLGIGYVDSHLLAATRLNVGVSLWTRDKRLSHAAQLLAVATFDFS
jgi:hypothetical protein